MESSKYKKIEAYLDGELSAESSAEVSEWLRETPPSADTDRATRELWSRLSEWDAPEQSRTAFAKFSASVGAFESPRKRLFHNIIHITRSAAAILIIPLIATCLVLLNRTTEREVEYCEFAVADGCVDSLRLPDNSMVWLNAGSRIIYPKEFGRKTRQVFLSGEAYFDVAKDASRPFILGSGDIKVRVLGTQFNVTSYEDMSSVVVSLIEGSVCMDVEHDGVLRNALLSPGDIVRYDKLSGEIEQESRSVDGYCSWRHGGFYFDDQPLSEIAAQFERVFGVKISIPEEHLRQTHYSLAFVNNESLEQMLAAIATNDNLRIRNSDDVIVITTR